MGVGALRTDLIIHHGVANIRNQIGKCTHIINNFRKPRVHLLRPDPPVGQGLGKPCLVSWKTMHVRPFTDFAEWEVTV